jgi:hypothetical protein
MGSTCSRYRQMKCTENFGRQTRMEGTSCKTHQRIDFTEGLMLRKLGVSGMGPPGGWGHVNMVSKLGFGRVR